MQIKATALAAFLLLAGCNADNPTVSLPASKHIEAEAEQCPIPLLGIVGTWAGSDSYRVDCPTCDNSFGGEYIYTADTLSIGFAPDPYPPGEPGVTYYDYTLLSYYSPSTWDDPGLADLDLPSLYREVRGKMGVYYADGGTWAFNHIVTHSRIWDEETKEYYEEYRSSSPSWDHEIKMFAGWLVLGRWDRDSWGDLYEENYKRVDDTSVEPDVDDTPVEPESETVAEITPEIVGLYGTLVSTFTNIFFAALIPGTTSVPGAVGGSVEIAGNDWTLQDYSPDGALIVNGALNVGIDQTPIPLTGTVTLSGSQEAELILNMELSIGTDGLSAIGTITIDGTEFDVAEVSAAAAAAAEAAG